MPAPATLPTLIPMLNPCGFMTRVNVPVGDVIGHGCNQVTDVVQQRGGNDGFPFARELRKMSSLQPVLGHRDRLAEVGGRAASAIERENPLDDTHLPFPSPSNAARLKTLSRVR